MTRTQVDALVQRINANHQTELQRALSVTQLESAKAHVLSPLPCSE